MEFNYSIFGNTMYSYLSALAIFVGGTLIAYIFRKYILSRLRKWAESTETHIDDLLVNAAEKLLLPIVYFAIFYIALHTLVLSPEFEHGLSIAAIVLITIFVVKFITSVVKFALQSYLSKSSDTDHVNKPLLGISGLISFIIWVLALFFLLDNLGVKISAVVAGLGIGGIAVALAAQAVLGDLFSYFVIFFDKPFEIGDFITIDDKMGVVEHIGIKTTRIRALGGEILVFSNTILTNSPLHNFKKMERRRVVFKLGIIYQTEAEKVKAIPLLVKDIIAKQQDASFDRAHFASYGDFSLNFEFVYYVTGADYNKYMDIQQAINLSIFEVFKNEGIEFAFPTRTIYINQ